MFTGPEDKLAQTEFTQPALYLTSYLAARSLIDDGTKPDMAAGHSVGEFAALAIAEAFSFLDGLKKSWPKEDQSCLEFLVVVWLLL